MSGSASLTLTITTLKLNNECWRLASRGYRGRRTYGYRRVKALLDQDGIHLADATVTRIMRQLGVQVSMYNQHRNGKYSSYRGTVGKIAQNVLQQSFTATKPYQVIHIDITQI